MASLRAQTVPRVGDSLQVACTTEPDRLLYLHTGPDERGRTVLYVAELLYSYLVDPEEAQRAADGAGIPSAAPSSAGGQFLDHQPATSEQVALNKEPDPGAACAASSSAGSKRLDQQPAASGGDALDYEPDPWAACRDSRARLHGRRRKKPPETGAASSSRFNKIGGASSPK